MEAETHSRNDTRSGQTLGPVKKRRRQSDKRLLDYWQIRRGSHVRSAQRKSCSESFDALGRLSQHRDIGRGS